MYASGAEVTTQLILMHKTVLQGLDTIWHLLAMRLGSQNDLAAFAILAANERPRKYGFRELIGNKAFVSQQFAVITMLRKAVDLLEPLGISREDLEKILDERLGVSGGYPTDGSQ